MITRNILKSEIKPNKQFKKTIKEYERKVAKNSKINAKGF